MLQPVGAVWMARDVTGQRCDGLVVEHQDEEDGERQWETGMQVIGM